MAKKSTGTKRKVAAAFHEVFHNKPSKVKKSKSAEGQRKQMVAIALSKARAAGADVPEPPSMQRGGIVPATGIYNVHRGEQVLTPGQARQMLPASGAFGTPLTGTPMPGTPGGMPSV